MLLLCASPAVRWRVSHVLRAAFYVLRLTVALEIAPADGAVVARLQPLPQAFLVHHVPARRLDYGALLVVLLQAEAALPLRPVVRRVVLGGENLLVELHDLHGVERPRLRAPWRREEAACGQRERQGHACPDCWLNNEQLQEQDVRVPAHEAREPVTALLCLLGVLHERMGAPRDQHLDVEAPPHLQPPRSHGVGERDSPRKARPHPAVEGGCDLLCASAEQVAREGFGQGGGLVRQEPHAQAPLVLAPEQPPCHQPAEEVEHSTTGTDTDEGQHSSHKEHHHQRAAEDAAHPRAARDAALLQRLRHALPDLGVHVLSGDLADRLPARRAMLHQLLDALVGHCLRQQRGRVHSVLLEGCETRGRGVRGGEAARGVPAARREAAVCGAVIDRGRRTASRRRSCAEAGECRHGG
mmetsp:Transcript_88753/g.248341  ORF Transcript_88753/g.248341 Transcript_88753/m.248341 type:complete len:412 (-) Transcript_88753:103-1338(-)